MPPRKRKTKPLAAPGPAAVPAPPSRRLLAGLAAVSLALLGFAVFWWTRPSVVAPDAPPRLPADVPPQLTPAEDPRLSIATPFLNVRPGVQYMGDEACVGCHRTLTHSYRQHPMG